MRSLLLALLLCPWLLFSGCLPLKQGATTAPSVATTPAPPKPSPPQAGPYWHGAGGPVTMAEALAYYAALKTLKGSELILEHQRLLEEVDSSEGRLARLQLVLLATLPEQTLMKPEEAITHLTSTRQDAEFHRDLADLLILLDDQLSIRLTAKGQEKEEGQKLRSLRKRLKSQTEELETCRTEREECRTERDELAGKLQKLQEIERGLIGRERK